MFIKFKKQKAEIKTKEITAGEAEIITTQNIFRQQDEEYKEIEQQIRIAAEGGEETIRFYLKRPRGYRSPVQLKLQNKNLIKKLKLLGFSVEIMENYSPENDVIEIKWGNWDE